MASQDDPHVQFCIREAKKRQEQRDKRKNLSKDINQEIIDVVEPPTTNRTEIPMKPTLLDQYSALLERYPLLINSIQSTGLNIFG
jgi:hypothetical protein